jgi:3-oxoacyl-[acyl-carrier-protein] synthase II
MRRVVITGIGAVTPLGNDVETTWGNLLKERSGISAISKFDPEGLPSRIAGELKGFNPGNYLPPKDILRLDPFIHYAAAAAGMACEDAKVDSEGMTRHAPAGVIVGSSRGGICSIESALKKHFQDEKPFSAYLMSSSTINMASSYISMRYNIKGPSLGISTACASGTNAIGEAFRMLREGYINVALTGGAEAPVCKLAVGGYGASGSLSKRNDDPEKASRPFDKDRDGFVLAEGAGILVLEELEHALGRGAPIYAELGGYGASSDAFHQTQPDSKGESAAILRALQDAGVSENSVTYINAHATSTRLGDRAEASAIKTVFGVHTGNVHISSSKSMLGHMLGAAGAVEAALSAISVKRGVLLPSINIGTPDPDINLNVVTAAVKKDIDIALTNSFGFGGVNAVLVIKKYRG